jgi:ATP-dependent RNA helicase RhlE
VRRAAVQGRERNYSAYSSSKPVDEFFLKPYEPSGAPVVPAAARNDQRSKATEKKSVGVLLGGR